MPTRKLDVAEWCVAVLLTLAVLFLLFVRARHAGALWRDECASVQVAAMPTLRGLLDNFQRESFPAVFYLVLRGFINLFGASDLVLRSFGFVVGVIFIMVVWINARLLTDAPPLVSLALFGLNSTFLVWGTTIRGYGIGSVLILLTFGLIAWMLVKPTLFRITVALLVAVTAVQMLLYNSVVLVAIALAVMVVCFIRKQLTAAVAVVGIGLLCLISMLPYAGPFWIESRSTVVLRDSIDVPWFWSQLRLAFGNPSHVMTCVWVALFAMSAAGALIRMCLTWSRKPTPESSLLLFGLVVLMTAPVAYVVFLKLIGYATREWYYLALLSILAGAMDLVVANLSRVNWIRGARLICTSCALFFLPLLDWPKVNERQSNIDLVARELEASAESHDLIVLNPWYYGVSFNWYYHGAAVWTTVPIISDHSYHRFDLLKAKMMSPNPLDDLYDLIGNTLRGGGRVWFVGGVWFLSEDQEPMDLPPAPASEFRWNMSPYTDLWSQQIGVFLRNHTFGGEIVRVRAGGPVNELENLDLIVIHGWRE